MQGLLHSYLNLLERSKNITSFKICIKCKLSKGKAKFHKKRETKDGLRPSCKSCDREYYLANVARIKNQHKDRYEIKKDEIKSKRRDYYLTHKEESRESNKRWYEANKEKARKRYKIYYDLNRDKLLSNLRYRHYKKVTTNFHAYVLKKLLKLI